ncbi:thiamine diphosphokinase [Bacillus dakarensis]|uniref:thiamine diphosphokinase n=1 Tax=Robertmurraya dakarensis TaxID=1926278 RepID=UPI00098229DE|nr:thiamine diphosphokinase [Bacillus dakarensis]
MIINIVAGGPTDHLPDLTQYNDHNCVWVGVDKGVTVLLEAGIKPAVGFGDFDSVSSDELYAIKKKVNQLMTYEEEKDETDTEHALNWAIGQNPDKIRIFGGTGGRLDHFFANVQLILKPALKELPYQVEIIDQKNIIFVTYPGIHRLNKISEKKYVSFIPVSSAVDRLTLEGFKYPLKDRHIPLGSTLCISNELLNDYGTFSFREGILMVIRSCD